MKVGLTLGKFAPFHKGHEFLISCALKEMDEVIVVVYNASETTEIPTRVRAEWIRSAFPTVKVILAENGPQVTGYTQEIIEIQNEYLRDLLKHIRVDTFYSSEDYGKHVSEVLKCNNRVVDLERRQVPVSGKEIRSNLQQYREYLSPAVFNAVKPSFYFLGGPSTGKTTIAQLAAQSLRGSYCEEFGREYWMRHQKSHRLTMEDLETIAVSQNKLELARGDVSMDLAFCDTNTITTLAYSMYYFNRPSRRLEETVERCIYKYKNVLLCGDEIPFDDTWDRSGPGSREKLQEINIGLLEKYGIEFSLLNGSVEQRLEQVRRVVRARNS